MTTPTFARLGLIEPLLVALRERGYETPTPIQERSIPLLLARRDLLGIAQTGTGKTAAFALPILQLLQQDARRPEPKRPRALVLAPTRELSSQIVDAFRGYGKRLPLRSEVVYGGVGMTPQVRALARGADILVATPGRLLDHMQQRTVDLGRVEYLVLDEADRMLDMGFIRDVERILRTLPRERQSLLFSATMPSTVATLARDLLRSPERVEVTPQATTTERVEQRICFVDHKQKRDLLVHLLQNPDFARTLVFARTRHGADRIAKHLVKSDLDARAIHGDKSQGQRERALADFRSGKCLVLIATDVAARGIDVPDVSHVLNFDLPNIPESYVHRIGRTARAGREGMAISFCANDEREYLRDIEKAIRQRIPEMTFEEIGFDAPPPSAHSPRPKQQPQRGRPQGRQQGRPQGGKPRQQSHRGQPARPPAPRQQPAPPVDWTEIARQIGESESPRRPETPRRDEPRRHGNQQNHGNSSQRGGGQHGGNQRGGQHSGSQRGHGGGGGSGGQRPSRHGQSRRRRG